MPVGLDATNVLERERDLARLGSILDRQLTEVPRESLKIRNDLFIAAIDLVAVVEVLLSLAQRVQQLLVHLGELESLPEVGNADLVVADVGESQERIVTFAVNLDLSLLDVTLEGLPHSVSCLMLHLSSQFLGHLLSGDAHQGRLELEAEAGFESNVDLLLRLGVDDTFMVVELEAAVEDLLHVLGVSRRATLISIRLHHLELDVQVAVRLVGDHHAQGLRVTDSDCAEVEICRADRNHAIGTCTNDLNELGRGCGLLHG